MAKPTDQTLYNTVKQRIYNKHPKHSAYRSGLLVKAYKTAFKKKHPNKQPYIGAKSNSDGLSRWFEEKWRNQNNKVGYQKKGDVYRPTIRINNKTPKTYSELSKSQISKAMRQKKKSGRVTKF